MLWDPEVISYLKILQEQYVMCPIDKAANSITFICKKYYVQVLLKESGLLTTLSSTYQQDILQHQNNTTLDPVFRLKNNDNKFYCLPCIFWLPKMHKISSGPRFIIAGQKCVSNQACYISIQTTLQPNRCISQKNIIFVGPKSFGFKTTSFL